MNTQPTDLLDGGRRTILVALPTRPTDAPTTVEQVLLSAARVIARVGLHRGDYVLDALGHQALDVPLYVRPMSVVGAIRFAATGSPQRTSTLAEMAVGFLALSLKDGPVWTDPFSLERHVDDWSDDVTAVEAVEFLELVATAPERAA
ncbi:hypothetical protein [Streptomyces sp. NBC_01565]|uniref:DUF6197 family protein n=1 Tax=Streptomyces sp. NBC_01565 TaxID=2975881 RepID=UPI00225AF5EF|nr:hypothetical protein [Streptomyces sp. NBC_01565]MCX4540456.1 hypothetical protein [Streptomyces sp. NBC_01565]